MRGLKLCTLLIEVFALASHPVWVRGLKLPCFLQDCLPGDVAPRVGAWIETDKSSRIKGSSTVAPRVGAWIETKSKDPFPCTMPSHPVWVRGLKHANGKYIVEYQRSHPVWVRGLKRQYLLLLTSPTASHPVWVRGLKPAECGK